MRRPMVLTATATLLLGWVGCSGTPESDTSSPETSSSPKEHEGSFSASNPSDQMGIQLSNIAEAIENVKDEASARETARIIAKAGIELQGVAKSMEGMSDAEHAAAAQQHAAKYPQQQLRIMSAMQKLVHHPEWMKIIQDEMKRMPGVGRKR